MAHIDETLKQWATPRQVEFIDAIEQHGSAAAAARVLDINKSTITAAIRTLKQKAAVQGYSPEHNLTRIIPAPFIARGHSSLYRRGEDTPLLEWVKSRLDDQQYQELLLAAYNALSAELPRLPPIDAPEAHTQNASLANLYVITDLHLGMRSWHQETGANWDLPIAERTATQCFMGMMRAAPQSSLAIIAILGDYFHSDGLVPVTPTSGHVLDQDSRFSKMIEAGVRLCRRVVEEALTRHSKVILLMAEGNHDLASSALMQVMFSALYENNPRIEVVKTPKPFYAIPHGKTGLFFHHGHLVKPDKLPLFFATEFPEIWGLTRKRYGHTGHFHRLKEEEVTGIKLIQHPTLASRDSHAARNGYHSERQATVSTYHQEHGLVFSNVVTPEMFSSAAA